MIPPLSAEERDQLEANLLDHGCLHALSVWQEEHALLDGHNRYAICTKHALPYAIHEISLPDLDAAKAWLISHQLGRRNLTPASGGIFSGESLPPAETARQANGPHF